MPPTTQTESMQPVAGASSDGSAASAADRPGKTRRRATRQPKSATDPAAGLPADNPPGSKVSMREVARLAKVSVATVSMVLNDNPRISRATHMKVQRLIGHFFTLPHFRPVTSFRCLLPNHFSCC